MSKIHIVREHRLSQRKAKTAVTKVAEAIAERFEVDYEWQNNVLAFERTGVHGEITLHDSQVEVDVNLGFLLSFLSGRIEEEIHKQLDEHFG